ncbi:hypothetical protein KAT36_04100 [Candidatus Pacearchaeota archaeon]|nr:hypothetical protein [Candidatus Pacearchaeota archaeon]
MKREVFVVSVVFLFVFGVSMISNSMTGSVIGSGMDDSGMMSGPSDESIECMENCVMTEGKVESVCMIECNMEPKPESTNEGEECMQRCIYVGCDERDFSCARKNMDRCEDECGMKGDAPGESEMGEEQRCISECVAKEDPILICGASKEGETGNLICQKCAESCIHLYEGPCLTDEELTEKENACETCEHCYGEPVMGSSGQGWDCIIDIECKDASGEFGDDAGKGDDSFEKGHEDSGVVVSVGEAIGNVFEGIGTFFKGLFD